MFCNKPVLFPVFFRRTRPPSQTTPAQKQKKLKTLQRDVSPFFLQPTRKTPLDHTRRDHPSPRTSHTHHPPKDRQRWTRLPAFRSPPCRGTLRCLVRSRHLPRLNVSSCARLRPATRDTLHQKNTEAFCNTAFSLLATAPARLRKSSQRTSGKTSPHPRTSRGSPAGLEISLTRNMSAHLVPVGTLQNPIFPSLRFFLPEEQISSSLPLTFYPLILETNLTRIRHEHFVIDTPQQPPYSKHIPHTNTQGVKKLPAHQ